VTAPPTATTAAAVWAIYGVEAAFNSAG
jgi:hypothetical protein